jgi:3-hydroxyacyl-CoA dehydrogenase
VILDEDNSFLINRLFLRLQAGLYNLHMQENIPLKELDKMVKEFLFPTGIFEMIDQVGIEVVYTSALNYTRNIPEKSFYSAWLEGMKALVDKKELGTKSGKGFYDYSGGDPGVGTSLPEDLKACVVKRMYPYYLEPLFETVKSGIFSKEQIEHIVKEYMDTGKSPFVLADEIGYSDNLFR